MKIRWKIDANLTWVISRFHPLFHILLSLILTRAQKYFVYIKVIPADSIIQQDKMFERKQVVKEIIEGFVICLCHAIKRKIK